MKKIYLQPAISEMSMEENKPIATSLTVVNEPKDNVVGDVKADGEWQIWNDEVTEE